MPRFRVRHARVLVDEALADTRVVLVVGARRSGKSTLVDRVVRGRQAEVRTLDSPSILDAARTDPVGFVDVTSLLAVDEIQRPPSCAWPSRRRSTRARPGRYLLTGSAQVLALAGVADALPGRIETVELWPFSQGEIDGRPDGFADAVFTLGEELHHRGTTSRADYAARIVRGGFPESVARTSETRRGRFLSSYVDTLVGRDVAQLSDIERQAEMLALLRLLAARSAQPLVANALSQDLRLSARSVHRYLGLLEEVFLVKRVPAWTRSISARAVGTPKLIFVDSGVAADLTGTTARDVLRPGSAVGPLREGFVLAEIARQLTWSSARATLSHYRTKDGVEVDAVLEDRRGRVVGIEVKAAATARAEDFRGLRHLAERVGDDLVARILLYTGDDTLHFGDRLLALPLSALWETSAPS